VAYSPAFRRPAGETGGGSNPTAAVRGVIARDYASASPDRQRALLNNPETRPYVLDYLSRSIRLRSSRWERLMLPAPSGPRRGHGPPGYGPRRSWTAAAGRTRLGGGVGSDRWTTAGARPPVTVIANMHFRPGGEEVYLAMAA
jgi:hypothetical protein